MIVSKTTNTSISTELSKAYNAPIYLDIKKIMTGYGPLPASEGILKENNWGEEKGYRIVIGFGKEFCKETILKKEPNYYWKYLISDFKNASFFFVTKVVGEIWTVHKNNSTQITSKYSFYNKNLLTYPITLCFVKLLWSGLQKKALRNIKKELEK